MRFGYPWSGKKKDRNVVQQQASKCTTSISAGVLPRHKQSSAAMQVHHRPVDKSKSLNRRNV